MKKTLVIICMHGDEQYGLEVRRSLSSEFDFIIGNPLALEKNQRFIESDLNRSFPGKADGMYEERRAMEILKIIKQYDRVIDLHSTSEYHPLVAIVTNPNEKKIEFARRLGVQNLVLMPEILAGGKSINDHHDCLITLELGPHESDIAPDVIELLKNETHDHVMNIFEVVDKIPKTPTAQSRLTNLKPVKKGEVIAIDDNQSIYAEFDFVPILANERSYKDVLCLAAKKIN